VNTTNERPTESNDQASRSSTLSNLIIADTKSDLQPPELTERPQWVCWRLERRLPTDDRLTKVPYNPKTGKKAKAGDGRTWGSYAEAYAAYERGGYDGIGYELDASDPFTGIDLDHCRDLETGAIAPWALIEVERFRSYTEISPSGRGLHIFVCGRIGAAFLSPDQEGRKVGDYEAYSGKHFLTVTGERFDPMPATIEERQAELNLFCAEHFAPKSKETARPQRPRSSLTLDDDTLIRKAVISNRNFASLWAGSIPAGKSASEADEALIAHLDFWTSGDVAQIERLMLASGLYRDKHDRPDYLARSIEAWQRDHPALSLTLFWA
jgi:putative DNA primase/helicase